MIFLKRMTHIDKIFTKNAAIFNEISFGIEISLGLLLKALDVFFSFIYYYLYISE